MSSSQRIMLSAGLTLTIFGMIYGFWYAVADEHPTLQRMGVSLASAFVEVAKGDMDRANEFLASYGKTRFEYIRDVHAHSHLATLSTFLLVLGLFFRQLAFSEQVKRYLAYVLIFGAVALPLGSFLEMFFSGAVPKLVAVLGALTLIVGLAVAAVGVLLPGKEGRVD